MVAPFHLSSYKTNFAAHVKQRKRLTVVGLAVLSPTAMFDELMSVVGAEPNLIVAHLGIFARLGCAVISKPGGRHQVILKRRLRFHPLNPLPLREALFLLLPVQLVHPSELPLPSIYQAASS